jgi:hypothetical protein
MCSEGYLESCDPQAVLAADALPWVLAGIVAFWVLLNVLMRIVPWERVRAYRWTPKACCDERRYGDYERRTLGLGLFLVLTAGLLLVPVGSAAPDTPPALSWSQTLSSPDASHDCDRTSTDPNGFFLVDTAYDQSGNVFALVDCADGMSNGNPSTLVYGWSSAGTQLWAVAVNSTNGNNSIEPIGMVWVPIRDGTLAILVRDTSQSSTPKQMILYVNSTTGGVTNRFGGENFANNLVNSPSPGFIQTQFAARYHNESTIDFYAASGSQGRFGVRCGGVNTANCTVLWEVTSSPDGNVVSWGGRSKDKVYYIDQSPSTAFTVNLANGAVDASAGVTAISNSEFFYRSSGADLVRLAQNGATSLRWGRHNADTLAETLETPTENQVYFAGAAQSTVGNFLFLDGGDSAFYAGFFQNGSNRPVSFVSKFNTTNGTSGMRWNITQDNCDGSVCGSANQERMVRPIITSQGGLFVGVHWDFTSGGTDDAFRSQVHYYGGAGTPRTYEFSGFESEAAGSDPVVVSPDADAAEGLFNFCTGMGFESAASLFLCGLVLVCVVVVVMIAATSSFTKGRGQAPMIAGAMGGFGMMMFNGFAGIWETWTIAVLIIVAGAIIAYYSRSKLGGGT